MSTTPALPVPPDEDDFSLQIQNQQFESDVRNKLSLYRATGDARFIWRAIAIFDQAGKPLPPELVAKLAEWGSKVQGLSDPKAIAAALELSGSGKAKVGPKHSAAFVKRWRLASEVQTVMRLWPSFGPKGASRIVARNRSLSFAIVNKAYHAVFTAPVGAAQRRMTVDAGTSDLVDVLAAWKS